MKNFTPFGFILIVSILLTSCVTLVNNTPGRPGRDGRAFFGVNFQYRAPYSYWDNNPAIPNNPVLGNYYPTAPGIYRFEYFVNPYEYWYGTYEIFFNAGGPGGPHGEPGLDGLDTYLMLFCDPNGFYTNFNQYRVAGSYENNKEPLIVERIEAGVKYKVTMQKAMVTERKSELPKYISNLN